MSGYSHFQEYFPSGFVLGRKEVLKGCREDTKMLKGYVRADVASNFTAII